MRRLEGLRLSVQQLGAGVSFRLPETTLCGRVARSGSPGRWTSFHSPWILNVVEIQLRDYRIRHGQMDAWIAGWKSGVVPLRQEAGFRIIGAWVDRQHDRFVWLVGYSGADGFEVANDRYYASQKRASLHPEPSELIEEARKVMVDAVL
jgi:hypothetical protein